MDDFVSLDWDFIMPAHSASVWKLGTHKAWVALIHAWSKLYGSHVWLALPISNKILNNLKLQPEELRIFDSEEFSS